MYVYIHRFHVIVLTQYLSYYGNNNLFNKIYLGIIMIPKPRFSLSHNEYVCMTTIIPHLINSSVKLLIEKYVCVFNSIHEFTT